MIKQLSWKPIDRSPSSIILIIVKALRMRWACIIRYFITHSRSRCKKIKKRESFDQELILLKAFTNLILIIHHPIHIPQYYTL